MPPNSRSRPGYPAVRKGRISLDGQSYLITFVTVERRPLFLDPGFAHTCAIALSDARIWRHAKLMAWVLMPDHWHGLVALGEAETLSDLVRRIKSNTSRELRLQHPDIPRVWQKGFHDRAIRSEALLRPAARYLVANPLRAGLATAIGDYPYWDAAWL